MFWRMTGLSTASPVDTILEKGNFTLEELLDEDEIIQECKALNSRLINFLRERTQVEQLLRYITEEPHENAEKKRSFKFPFIACEIFTCEVDILLRTLVEDSELMDLLFSFLKPDHPHSTLLAGYFSKLVICLMMRKTTSLFNYIQGHPEIIGQLVDLIGITSIMEVLIRLIGADENVYSNFADTMQWLENIDVLEMIVDKLSSSDSPEVHANAAEILCAVTRYAPPVLATKICSPIFVGRLFRHALEDSRPKSVLVHSLSVCISLLDPKRLVASSYQAFRSHLSHGSLVTTTPETVEGILENLGDLLKLLDVSPPEHVLLTSYGKLQPPLGKHRLKIVEFISVLLTIGSEVAEKELIRLGAIKHTIDLFFEYPFNNFLHHHVESIITSCLESKKDLLINHILHDNDMVGRILEAENQSTLSLDSNKPTVPAEGKTCPRIGNVGHMTRISNKLIQLGNNNSIIQTHLQENSQWIAWHSNVLLKRSVIENVYNWTCGRPTPLHDRGRDSDDEDFKDRDYDVAALASNLSQAFRCGIYSNDTIAEVHGSFERDDEDVYFDDESAEVVISSLRLGDDQESSLFTNSNWFTFESDNVNDRSVGSFASPSPSSDDVSPNIDESNDVVGGENDGLVDSYSSLQVSHFESPSRGVDAVALGNSLVKESEVDSSQSSTNDHEKLPEWVEWRETSKSEYAPETDPTPEIPDGEIETYKDIDEVASDAKICESSAEAVESERPTGDASMLLEATNALVESVTDMGNGSPSGDLTESAGPNHVDSSTESVDNEAAKKDF